MTSIVGSQETCDWYVWENIVMFWIDSLRAATMRLLKVAIIKPLKPLEGYIFKLHVECNCHVKMRLISGAPLGKKCTCLTIIVCGEASPPAVTVAGRPSSTTRVSSSHGPFYRKKSMRIWGIEGSGSSLLIVRASRASAHWVYLLLSEQTS